MSKNFDLNLLPLYRLRGNEHPSPPGLLALTPPRRKARSRARDMLLVHLILGGNAVFSTANYLQMTSAAAEEFYKTPGSVTAALRAAALTLNGDLIEQNMAASGKGRFTLATLVLGAVRGETLYLLIAGPAHVYWMAGSERRDIHDPEMAGRGLGFGQNAQFYLTQLPIRARGRLLITPELPDGWKLALQRDNQSAALETIRSVLMRQNMMDQNAVLIEVKEGHGNLQILKPPRPFKPTLASISQKIAEAPQLRSHQPEPQPMLPIEAEEAPAEPEEKPEAPQPPPAPPAEVSSHSPQQIVKEILEDAEARRKPHLSMPGFERPPQPPPKRPAEFPVSIPRQRAEQEKPAPEPIVEHTPEPKK